MIYSSNSMKPFLKLVADDLRRKMNNDLSRLVVVFPNKRASLFMNEYLVPESDESFAGPMWAPRYMTISEFFGSLSSLRVVDPVEAVCRLHRHYVQLTHSQETLDFFYGWGERLLADFDDVDKNMADVARLFRNIKEIKELDAGGGLNEEHEQVLRDFFRDFSLKENSQIRTKFLELWNVMLPLYERLNAELASDGLAYEGALYRGVVRQLLAGKTALPEGVSHYAFVGFNVLDKVEETLFGYLKEQGKAFFYWDYDTYYTEENVENEAGVFLRRNMKLFPGELSPELFDNLRHDKDIEYVSAPAENAGARTIGSWLDGHLTADAKRTAIVLCNEKMLLPVLHSLPPAVKETNITKGFPLHHTAAFMLIEKLAAGDDESITAWLDRAKAATKEAAQSVAKMREKEGKGHEDFENILATEAYFQTYTILNRFARLAENGLLDVTITTLSRLVRQVMRQTAVPFHGEPVVGLQIMGMLETRGLDFENVLILSVNEGYLPGRMVESSFIPYNLRCEFGLTTSRHKTAVYAYYFYRLIQRAHHVRMIYNGVADGNNSGEMSRFMTQLKIESGLPVRQLSLTGKLHAGSKALTAVRKPADLAERIARISPSAINTYLRCQLQFYFRYVARLKREQPATAVLAPNTFGTIFHKAAELIYGDEQVVRRKGLVTKEFLTSLLDKEGEITLLKYVRRAFVEENETPDVLVEEVVKSYLKNLLRHDLHIAPFEVKGMELSVSMPLTVRSGEKIVGMTLLGNIDRLDVIDINGLSCLRVVDYKTGGNPEKARDMEQLFVPDKNHPHYILQTFLYSLTLVEQAKLPIVPSLFFVHKASAETYSPYLNYAGEELYDFRKIAPEFKERLEQLLEEILDEEHDFVATDVARNCDSCDFYALCKK